MTDTHSIRWDNEDKTVVILEYFEGSTKDDLYVMAQRSAEMLATVPHTVHQIIDETHIHLTLYKADLNFLEKLAPANQGIVLVVPPPGGTAYKEMIKNLAGRLIPDAFSDVLFVPSVEEARKILMASFGVNY